MINDYKKRDPHFLYGDDFNDKPIYKKINNFLNRSMRSFQNIFLMPEVFEEDDKYQACEQESKKELTFRRCQRSGGYDCWGFG